MARERIVWLLISFFFFFFRITYSWRHRRALRIRLLPLGSARIERMVVSAGRANGNRSICIPRKGRRRIEISRTKATNEFQTRLQGLPKLDISIFHFVLSPSRSGLGSASTLTSSIQMRSSGSCIQKVCPCIATHVMPPSSDTLYYISIEVSRSVGVVALNAD